MSFPVFQPGSISGGNRPWGYVPTPVHHDPGFLGTVAHLFGQTATDVIDALRGSAGAAVHAVPYIFTHTPTETAEQIPGIVEAMGKQTWADLQHPLRHPGFTIMDLASLAPIPGAAFGRAATIGATLARGGELSARLAEAVRPALAAGDFDSAAELARGVGRESEFTRVFKKDPETGAPVPRSLERQVTTAVLRGAPRRGRLLRGPATATNPDGDLIPGWHFSRDPFVQGAQMLVDKAYDRFPNGVPPFIRSQGARIRSATRQQNVARAMEMGSDAAAFMKQFGSIHDVYHLVGRMIKTGTSADVVRKYYSDILEGRYKPETRVPREIQVAESQRMLQLVDQAEPLMENVTHTIKSEPTLDAEGKLVEHPWTGNEYSFEVPTLKKEFENADLPDGKGTLGEYVAALDKLARDREVALSYSGTLPEDSAVSRIISPLHEMMHRDLPYYGEHLTRAKQSLAGIEKMQGGDSTVWKERRDLIDKAEKNPPIPQDVAEKLIQRAGLQRIHYDIPPARKLRHFTTADFRRRKAYKATRAPTPPGTLTHPFGAEVMRSGGGDLNTARLMAATTTEAMRYVALHKNWLRIANNLQEFASGIPERRRVLVRKAPGEGPPDPMTRTEAEKFIYRSRMGEELSKEQAEALGMQYENVRQGLFPKQIWDPVSKMVKSVKALAKQEDVPAPPGYGWADSALLGGLDKQNPLITLLHDYPIARTGVKLLDAINTINKFALLYLKPAYIAPNMFGNVAMNLIQQGFMAPVNLGKAFYLWKTAAPDVKEGLLSTIGEGSSKVISEQPQGTVASRALNLPEKAARKAGGFYGSFVDTPFRLASFLHEASIDGITSMEELKQLIKDPKRADQRADIASRANDAIINFELMDPAEQAIMRRLVFFYPWIKGATRYTANLYKEHPVAFGAQQAAGHQETERQHEILGDVPAWASGLVPWGRPDKLGHVDVSNPQAFSILGTPADMIEKFKNIVERNPDQALALLSELSPADRMMIDIISGGATAQKRSRGGAAVNAPYMTAFQDYTGGNPVKLFYERLMNQQKPTSVYTNQSWPRDLSMFAGLGTLTPRTFRDSLARYYQFQHKRNPAFYG